ncbi:Cytochrome c oxidase subunit 4, mitochondrial [Sphaceloma murrayae]|uniref:Cytochrome c oxidase subunit 4, mitochondrial n=1 Tax=Sphaceloma murrayae TaxID=2082308 RepID=A0A2K1R0Y9_9PEZI|nr:Cytochrome c oxidase subunit 4, mitochondrial [Sphaceloma murrayae]
MSSLFLRRSALAVTRRAVARPAIARPFSSSIARFDAKSGNHASPKPGESSKSMKPFEEVESEADLMPPGAAPGTVPTDLEQATGLERLEILGKMQGVDIFDMRPLDASRKGTVDNPITVKSFGDEQYVGCTGCPADSHVVIWLTCSRERPIERCPECGSVYKMEYVGPQEDAHGHGEHGHDDHGHDDHHGYEEPKTMADFVRPEYR